MRAFLLNSFFALGEDNRKVEVVRRERVRVRDHHTFLGKLPTHLSPKPTLTLTSHLGQNVGLGEG